MSYVKLEMTEREYDEWLQLKTSKNRCDFALCLYAAKVLHVEPEDETNCPPEEDKWEYYDYSPDQRDSWIAWALVAESGIDCDFTKEEVIDDDYIDELHIYRNLPWAEDSIFIVYVDTEEYVHPAIDRFDLTDYISGFDSAKRHVDTWLNNENLVEDKPEEFE